MCLYPKIIKNKKYQTNKKNGGNVPTVKDIRTQYVPVGCGKCIECSKQKSRNWQVRLLEDVRHHKNGKFITLTYSNESIKELSKEIVGLTGYELDNEIATLSVRRFLERWRKKYGKSLRHWLVTELGHTGTEHLHIHGILWTDNIKEVEKIWKYGFIWTGKEEKNYVNEKTVNYLVKYVNKVDRDHKEYKPKILTSAGIGGDYVKRKEIERNKYQEEETNETYTTRTGHKIAMPSYWRNKIYTDEEREKLWIQKLDKEERWVCGIKIDISKNEEEYYRALEWYRAKSKRLGYGDDAKNWERKKYENDRRKLKQWERVNNIKQRPS